jgi:hypothetical protein
MKKMVCKEFLNLEVMNMGATERGDASTLPEC